MQPPHSLPARLYLLAWDPRRERPVTGYRLSYPLRAAALTELLLGGQLTDDGDRPRAGTAGRVADPVLAAVLREVAKSRPRSWERWIRRNDRATARAVRSQLAAGGWIRVEPRRILGIFPADRITISDPLLRRRLTDTVHRLLRAYQPPSQVDARDAALVALVAAAGLRTVLTRAQRREHADRIARLTELTGPTAPALRKAIRRAQSANTGGG